jgi:hypothetical protein
MIPSKTLDITPKRLISTLAIAFVLGMLVGVFG